MNTLFLALQITALGMGLVFGAILLLWGMMNLLTSVMADRAASSSLADKLEATHPALPKESDLKAQAAAAAVAMAFAEQESTLLHPLSDPPTAIVSAWILGMRTRQMYQKGGSFRRRAR